MRNGDAHLKNIGVLYSSETDIRLAPMFDMLTTSICKYTRFGTGEEIEDRTMALKLRKGDKTRTYPLAKELLDFGRRVCGVDRPQEFIMKAADAMATTLTSVQRDDRVPKDLASKMEVAWEYRFALARAVASLSRLAARAPSCRRCKPEGSALCSESRPHMVASQPHSRGRRVWEPTCDNVSVVLVVRRCWMSQVRCAESLICMNNADEW